MCDPIKSQELLGFLSLPEDARLQSQSPALIATIINRPSKRPATGARKRAIRFGQSFFVIVIVLAGLLD